MVANFLYLPWYPWVIADHRAGYHDHLGAGDVPV
jgi:hypothetical protein